MAKVQCFSEKINRYTRISTLNCLNRKDMLLIVWYICVFIVRKVFKNVLPGVLVRFIEAYNVGVD